MLKVSQLYQISIKLFQEDQKQQDKWITTIALYLKRCTKFKALWVDHIFPFFLVNKKQNPCITSIVVLIKSHLPIQ